MPLMPCPTCGRQISDRAATCLYCGAPTHHANPRQQPFWSSPTAQTAAKGITAWLLVAWIGKIVFAIAGLAFLAYLLTR